MAEAEQKIRIISTEITMLKPNLFETLLTLFSWYGKDKCLNFCWTVFDFRRSDIVMNMKQKDVFGTLLTEEFISFMRDD